MNLGYNIDQRKNPPKEPLDKFRDYLANANLDDILDTAMAVHMNPRTSLLYGSSITYELKKPSRNLRPLK